MVPLRRAMAAALFVVLGTMPGIRPGMGAEPPAAGPAGASGRPGIASRGRIHHIEYLRARPGREADYDRFIETVFRPMLDEMVRRGIWQQYNFMTVPYAGPAPCADYTHVFVARLANFAALDREIPAWNEIAKKLHPDDAERHRLFDEELPAIRDMVREEILQDFDWK